MNITIKRRAWIPSTLSFDSVYESASDAIVLNQTLTGKTLFQPNALGGTLLNTPSGATYQFQEQDYIVPAIANKYDLDLQNNTPQEWFVYDITITATGTVWLDSPSWEFTMIDRNAQTGMAVYESTNLLSLPKMELWITTDGTTYMDPNPNHRALLPKNTRVVMRELRAPYQAGTQDGFGPVQLLNRWLPQDYSYEKELVSGQDYTELTAKGGIQLSSQMSRVEILVQHGYYDLNASPYMEASQMLAFLLVTGAGIPASSITLESTGIILNAIELGIKTSITVMDAIKDLLKQLPANYTLSADGYGHVYGKFIEQDGSPRIYNPIIQAPVVPANPALFNAGQEYWYCATNLMADGKETLASNLLSTVDYQNYFDGAHVSNVATWSSPALQLKMSANAVGLIIRRAQAYKSVAEIGVIPSVTPAFQWTFPGGSMASLTAAQGIGPSLVDSTASFVAEAVMEVLDGSTGTLTVSPNLNVSMNGGTSTTTSTLVSSTEAMAPLYTNGTGANMLTTSLNLQVAGVSTGQVSAAFLMMLPNAPIMSNGAGGFPVLKIGSGSGSILLQYVPIEGGGNNSHLFELSVVGDPTRLCVATPNKSGVMLNVYVEYDGSDLLLVVGDSCGTFHATSLLLPTPTASTAVSFAANAPGTAYANLSVFNTILTPNITNSPTSFPYMLWDGANSGVIAQLPVTPTLGTYYTFVDTGFHAGHIPASFNLASASAVPATVTLYVNEQPVTLTWAGGTVAQFVTWLTTNNGGLLSFPFDSLTESIQFTSTGASSFTAAHSRAGVLGQYSFSLRFESGIVGNNWSTTVAILGKVPQQFYQPHTGKLNAGVSMLGITKSVTTAKSLSLSRRDDAVRTVGRVIGNIQNRPVAQTVLTPLTPIPFFGANQAPYPKGSMVWGNPNQLNTYLAAESAYCYGVTWTKFLELTPTTVCNTYPNNRSHIGDTIMGFSLDIPYGQILRGINNFFAPASSGLIMNPAGYDTGAGNVFDWGQGAVQFPLAVSGDSGYTLIYYLMVATAADGSTWTTVPSIGADAIKVSGSGAWKTINFSSLDFQTLNDINGVPLLQGSRRTHFKLVLASELTGVAMNGLSYTTANAGKK